MPITLYLNQRLAFDTLAALEDGFSRLAIVQTTSSGETATEVSGGAQLGNGNPFALLGVQFGAHGSRQAEQGSSESVIEEIVHTPASLFARLRRVLRNRDLVHDMPTSSDLDTIRPGDFVEFEATLRKNPLIELLLALSELLSLAELAGPTAKQTTTQSRQTRKGGGNQRNQSEDSNATSKHQIGLLLSAVTAEGGQDLIAEAGSLRAVLTTERKYFVDPSMNDTIDGKFRVFGKASRVIPGNTDEHISLLRKTPLGKFGNIANKISTLVAGFEDLGFSGRIETDIPGPTMQVLPIAIFL